MNNNLLEVSSVTQSFIKPDGHTQIILDRISFDLKAGEIIAILGKSGCGKSTLLRIIAGLSAPSKGKINFHHKKTDKNFGISMIFQSFALFPWLTVLENVELGLQAMDIPIKECRNSALQAINLIGLEGFESAYPRELSGGMKQRVGFARALVVNPEILLMDEPFSALDVLTSETLKNDFLDLWISKKTSLKSVIIVTHSIEEAVMMADRVLILSSNPGHIASELPINLPRPRNIQTQDFHNMVDTIYSRMVVASQEISTEIAKKVTKHTAITQNLPFISPNQLAAVTGVIISSPYNGSSDLAELVKVLRIKTIDILHIAEALSILKFATVSGNDIKLNKDGKIFANGNLEQRKRIFAKHLVANVPLAAYIVQLLYDRPDNKVPKLRLQTNLEDNLSHKEAIAALRTIIALGRYAEIFSYDDDKQVFSLENPTYVKEDVSVRATR